MSLTFIHTVSLYMLYQDIMYSSASSIFLSNSSKALFNCSSLRSNELSLTALLRLKRAPYHGIPNHATRVVIFPVMQLSERHSSKRPGSHQSMHSLSPTSGAPFPPHQHRTSVLRRHLFQHHLLLSYTLRPERQQIMLPTCCHYYRRDRNHTRPFSMQRQSPTFLPALPCVLSKVFYSKVLQLTHFLATPRFKSLRSTHR